jgi:phosphonate degradation associated HDIG domain protein
LNNLQINLSIKKVKKNIVDYLLSLLEKKGSDMMYGGEKVSQLEHALQCAELAEKNKLSNSTITAALLHDIGHFLYEYKDPIHEGKDGHHENLGANFLSKYFGEEVINPIRAHVDSKKYLTSVEVGYYDSLSEASQISLAAQGGPFSKEEAEEFINKPFMREAVEMRRFDDMAKIINKKTPELNHFKPYLDDAIKSFN